MTADYDRALLDFSAPSKPTVDRQSPMLARRAEKEGSGISSPPAFGEEPELPPTWSEASRIFHTTEKCTRLQSIRRNRRVTGHPGLREHCLNCLDIVSTKRRG